MNHNSRTITLIITKPLRGCSFCNLFFYRKICKIENLRGVAARKIHKILRGDFILSYNFITVEIEIVGDEVQHVIAICGESW
jgi:hypothetical protein